MGSHESSPEPVITQIVVLDKRPSNVRPFTRTYTTHDTTPERILLPHLGNPRERRALDFFVHRCAPALSGLYSSSFWFINVLRLSFTSPTIRDAVIAVSVMYEAETMGGISPLAEDKGRMDFALRTYSRSIRSLIKDAEENPEGILVPAVAAIIFTCFEHMRANLSAAIVHAESGIKMVKAWRDRRREAGLDRGEYQFVERELVPSFVRLNLVLGLFGKPNLGLFSYLCEEGEVFLPRRMAGDLDEAALLIIDIFNAVIALVACAGVTKYEAGGALPFLVEEQVRLEGILVEWFANFCDLCSIHYPNSEDFQDLPYVLRHVVAIYYCTYLWAKECLNPYECGWDKWKDEFDIINQVCEGIVADDAMLFGDGYSGRFSYEMGTIPPLHFTALKCRWPATRRRAFELLRIAPRKEGPFQSLNSALAFTKAMNIEEECFGFEEGQMPEEDQLPPEEFRVHQAAIDPRWKGDNLHVQYLTKPYGIDGPYRARPVILSSLTKMVWDQDMKVAQNMPFRIMNNHSESSATPKNVPDTVEVVSSGIFVQVHD